MDYNNKTAKEIKEIGQIVYDIFDEGLRFIIMRGPYHWCGYVGIPKEHPLAGMSYEDISFLRAHGGFTFASEGKKEGSWPEGYYWYGWDYGHLGDYSYYADTLERKNNGDKDWIVGEVIEDSQDTIYDFKKLLKLAEKIKNK